MILAGTSPQACEHCGAPWARKVKRVDKDYDGSRYGERARDAAGGALDGGTGRSTLGSSKGSLTADYETDGWRPTCDCENAGEGRSVVLDPFAGSGTTLVVALRHGRSALGIELNPEYVGMARERIRQDAPLFNLDAEVNRTETAGGRTSRDDVSSAPSDMLPREPPPGGVGGVHPNQREVAV